MCREQCNFPSNFVSRRNSAIVAKVKVKKAVVHRNTGTSQQLHAKRERGVYGDISWGEEPKLSRFRLVDEDVVNYFM